MPTRIGRRFADTLPHSLESLEARAFLSAAGLEAPAMPTAAAQPAIIADEAFLTVASDAAAPSTASDDTEMYDFGGAWGSQITPRAASAADLDFGAVDQMGDRPSPRNTPSDVIAVAPPQWSAPAEYEPIVIADAPSTPAGPAPTVNAPETPELTEALPADQTPVAFATDGAPAADTTFVWIESSESWLLTTKRKAADPIVIESTFVQ